MEKTRWPSIARSSCVAFSFFAKQRNLQVQSDCRTYIVEISSSFSKLKSGINNSIYFLIECGDTAGSSARTEGQRGSEFGTAAPFPSSRKENPPSIFYLRRTGRSLARANHHQVARTSVRGRPPPFVHFFQNMKFTSLYIANRLITCQWLVFCFIPFRLLSSGISWIDEIIVGSLLASAVVPLNKSVV
jgi:hypothetical protein